MTAAVDRRFVARRHVDYGRVRSAMCPASWRHPILFRACGTRRPTP